MPYPILPDPVAPTTSPIAINVKDFTYGAKGDGITDDTTAIQNAINAVNAAGGGLVFLPAGTYLHSGLILYSFTHLRGAGMNATTLKLKNGANTDSIQGFNAPSLMGGSSGGGIVNWSIQEMTIDGNKSNQSGTSYGIQQYGYGFILQNIIIRNTLSDIIRSDWNGGSASSNDSMEARVINCKFHDSGTGAIGLNWTGPHDSQFTNVITYKTGSHAYYIGQNATGMLFTNCHGFNMATGVNAITWLIEATGFQAVNCVAEGSDVCNVVLLNHKASWVGGSIFCFNTGSPINAVSGIQIGQQAGLTPYPGSSFQSAGVTTAAAPYAYVIDTLISNCEGANGSVWFANDAGDGFVRAPVSLETNANPSKVYTGSPNASTQVWLAPNGVTADGTRAKGGTMQIGIAANQAITVNDTLNDIVNINTSSKKLELVNGTALIEYSDNYSTTGMQVKSGTVGYGVSGSAAAIVNGNTITTSGVGIARVNPAGNVTGIALQVGTFAGQRVTVANASSFTVTFDTTPGNSNIASSASDSAIPAKSARAFVWLVVEGFWYKITA